MNEARERQLAEKLAAFEDWADRVRPEELIEIDTSTLRRIVRLVDQRRELDAAIVEAVRDARGADHSWSEIGFMLGVSKQAAQQKYAKLITT